MNIKIYYIKSELGLLCDLAIKQLDLIVYNFEILTHTEFFILFTKLQKLHY